MSKTLAEQTQTIYQKRMRFYEVTLKAFSLCVAEENLI
jgi:hypothetical protein